MEPELPTVVGIERIPLRVVRGIGLDFQAMADEVFRDREGRLIVVFVADNRLYLLGRLHDGVTQGYLPVGGEEIGGLHIHTISFIDTDLRI